MNKELKPCLFCSGGCILRDFSFTFSFFDTLYFVTILFSGSKKGGNGQQKRGFENVHNGSVKKSDT